ncbi:zinc finger protein 865 [Electrophorus electricus]|uniref:C2H2-type domain-containing protein n=1 Tax=Electrophorus electricus TaxID=8005 RepID=A0A4W4FNQ8_ELEEL|nr:zinc finger protein 865 [Electrophorus electricus]XP_026854901.2 zinc finger protein 865 [Electrophorus electricus]XP_026854902.2 zinc finger protein 865 [Electrophorus electricus]XP_026854903.2 zinc finger protein 865 [Electrophorus electricus]
MFQFGKYNVDIIEMLSGHQAHQFKGLGLERQLQHQQQVQLHQHQLQQQQQQQVETSGAILSGLGLGPLQGSRTSAFSDSASIFAKMSAPPPPLQQQSLSSSSQSSRKSSKMSGGSSSGGSHVSGYPQFLRSFHPTEAALAQEQLHPGVGRFDHFAGSSGGGGGSGGIGGLVSSVPPPPPPLHPGLSVPQASPGPSSSSPSPSSSVSSSNNPPSSSTVTSLGHQLAGPPSDARSLHQQFSCMLAANQYFLSGVPANSSLEQFLVQQGSHNHLGLGLSQTGGESSSGLAPPPALHSSHTHSHSASLPQPQQHPPQQQQLPPHTLSHPHPHPHHPLHSSSQPSSLGSFDFQGIPVLSSNQLASLMQQEAGLPLPLPLHLSLSKDEGKGDGTAGGSGGGRRKKAMAGYLPQRKSDSSGNNNNSSNSHSSANPNPSSSSTSGGLSQDNPSGLGGGGPVGMSGLGRDPPPHLTPSSSSSVVSSSSSAAPSSTSASVLVTNNSKTDNHGSMPPPSSQPEPEPLYHCGECGKTFTHLSSLRRHLRCHEITTAGTAGTRSNIVNPVLHPADPSIPHSTQESSASSSCHSPDKNFQCSDCGKGFKKKGHLLQHGVIHSGARPYACTTCSRAFNRRESLTRHEKIHEEKPFRCPACGRCFRESTSLLNHAASGTCGKSGRGPRPKNDSSSSVVGGKSNKTGASSDGMVTSAVVSYRSDGYNENYKDQRSQGNLYSGSSLCGGGIGGAGLRKTPLAPTLHPHPQGQSQQPPPAHLPLSSLLDDSEDDVTSSVNNAISAITAAAANCMSGDLNHSGGRGDDRRDIIGGLLGGLGLGPLGSPGGPSSTSGMDKSYRGGASQDALASSQQPNQQTPGGKPKRPRKPRKKKEPGTAGAEAPKRRQSSQRTGIGDVRPYLCSICGRGFARRETLRRHDRIHTGEKPHHCTVCGKYFREAFHLSKHHTVHSGEKNYKCVLCGKDFGYAQSLKRHGKLHQKGEMEEVPTTPGGENLTSYPAPGGSMIPSGQGNSTSFYPYPQDVKPQAPNPPPPPRLYTCAVCWKSFRHHFHLTAHHQTVHEGGGDKLFSCEVCGKAFAYSNSLTRHRLSQHGLARTGQGGPPGSTSVTGEDSGVGGSVSESEAATNALLQLAPAGGGQGDQQPHGGVLHSHQQAPPQPQAGYSPLFYVPEAGTSLPSSSNTAPYSQPLPSSSSIMSLSHQHTGVKGEPTYQTAQRHTLNPNLPVHSLVLPPPEQQQQHHHHHHHHHHQQHQQHPADVQPHHHHGFHSEEDLRRRKKKKKRWDRREKIGYEWSPTAKRDREQLDLSDGGRKKNERRKHQRRRRRAFRRRQRKFRKKMAMLMRFRRGGGGSSVVCELGPPAELELYRLLSLQVPLRRFPCPFCFLTAFSRRAALVVHIAARHCPRVMCPPDRLRCPVCGKQSRRFLSALIHRSSHLSNRAFSCKLCPSRFWNAALLTRHKRTCQGKPSELKQRRALCLKLTTGKMLKRGVGKGNISTLQIEYSH